MEISKLRRTNPFFGKKIARNKFSLQSNIIIFNDLR